MDKQQTAVKNFLMKAYYVDEHINSKLEQVASLNELAVKATADCQPKRPPVPYSAATL